MPITFSYVDSDPGDLRRIQEVYRSGQYSPGARCKEFEDRFKGLHGQRHALFVNSGTDALRLGLLALKEKYRWPDGSLVIVPEITFVATVNAVLQAGLAPCFVDVGMHDYNLNPDAVERYLETTPSTDGIKAILPVHLFGQIAQMEKIMAIAKKYKLRVIEDSCESVFSSESGKLCGTFGDVSCFSTYQCHIIATGVGGIAMTNDDQLNELMRSYANHGRNPIYLPGYRKPKLSKELIAKRFQFERVGYSNRPSEFEAALGIGQLERLDRNLKERRAVADALIYALGPVEWDLALPNPERNRSHSYMMFPLVLRETSRFKKKDLLWFLEMRGIETRDMMPITTQPVYRKLWLSQSKGSVSSWINANGFYIPCHPGMKTKDIQSIRRAFLDFFKI